MSLNDSPRCPCCKSADILPTHSAGLRWRCVQCQALFDDAWKPLAPPPASAQDAPPQDVEQLRREVALTHERLDELDQPGIALCDFVPELVDETVRRLHRAEAELTNLKAASPSPPQDKEIVVAMLAACEATIRHLWDIAGRFESRNCNAIRDEIHRLNKITLPSIRELEQRLKPASAPSPVPEGWQTGIETAPKDGSWIVVAATYNPYRRVAVHWETCGWADDQDVCRDSDVEDSTHWMPLPPAPRQASEAEK